MDDDAKAFWSKLPPDELERRRRLSVDAMTARERAEFDLWYQEKCDRLYWTKGRCCAGCDHWSSDSSLSGRCAAAGIMSGGDVLKSMGVTFSSHTPPPGFPYSEADFHCGKFSDDFDWTTLDDAYLTRIGAMRNGKLRSKPATASTDPR